MTLTEILEIYNGSDGAATRALYERLQAFGPAGEVALNLFRAQKCSARAKLYRGRGYRGEAYDRKQWSIDNLARILGAEAPALGIAWGWGEDAAQPVHRWVLYVDLPFPPPGPAVRQVSFHCAGRGEGPAYPGRWDGVRDIGAQRICSWIAGLLGAARGANAAPLDRAEGGPA